MRWFSSDWHIGHPEIINYCNRPYKDCDEMDDTLLSLTKEIKMEDHVYFLGDFGFGNRALESVKRYCNANGRIQGQWHFILGNHDTAGFIRKLSPFMQTVEIVDYKVARINSTNIVMFHYPMLSWKYQYQGSFHLYGHVHSTNFHHPCMFQMNVCVDCTSYKLLSWTDIMNTMTKKWVQKGQTI